MNSEYETRQQNTTLNTLKQRTVLPTLIDQKPNVLYTMPVQTVERLEAVLEHTLALQEDIRSSMTALATKVHTASASGHGCGAKRPQCGDSGHPAVAIEVV